MYDDDNNKNLILATALSFLVILVWFVLFPPEEPAPLPEQSVAQSATGDATTPPKAGGEAAVPTLNGTPLETRENALSQSTRIAIKTARLEGSLSLKGGRIDDLKLLDYNVELNDPSEKITLLSPAGGPRPYYTVYGWAPAGSLGFDQVPGANTDWQIESGAALGVGTPVTLKWDNGAGLIFRREVALDENYMFSIKQSVENNTGADVRMAPYAIIAQQGAPERAAYGRQQSSKSGVWILHEGIVQSVDGDLTEIDYSDIPDLPFSNTERSQVEIAEVQEQGWIGFTGKYWMTTLIPQAGQPFKAVSKYLEGREIYQAEMRLPAVTVATGTSYEAATSLFAGAKEYDTIRAYEKNNNVVQFIDSIDWGWFFFLTKPIFWVLHQLNLLIGNMGWAIIGLTLVIKAILFPLAYKSYVSMAKMKDLQPEMEALKEKHGDDRQAMQQGMMKLYKEKKVNPAAGCLPILLQIPIFFSLYKVIFVTIEMYHAPFIGWITNLSAPDPTSYLNLFGLLPWAPPDPTGFFGIFSIGVFPILMGVTMWLQQKLNPAPTDKMQAQIFAWLPWIFMFMLGGFAAGLVIYWVANNTITFIQQYTIMRSQGVKPDIWGNMFGGLRKEKKAD